jgi:ABC-type multidrug transport system fused ATPase/permease subunit
MKTIKKILYLFSPYEQKRALLLLFLILIMTMLDVLGIASILPFVSVLANPTLVETNKVLAYIYQLTEGFGVSNTKEFIFVLGFSVFVFLIISLTFRAFTSYAQIRFALMREYSIGKRLIEGYLHQPYVWFLNKHSADLGKNILSEVGVIINLTILPMINFIAHSAVSIALMILLIFIDPVLALSVGMTLGACYGAFFLFMKNKISQTGTERLLENRNRFSTLVEAFGASKEIKIGGLENVYINRYTKSAKIYATNQSLAQVTSQLPRYFIEGIAFGGMILISIVLIYRGGVFENIAPIIALYAFAGYRLIPSLQNIYYNLVHLRHSESSLDSLHADLKNLKTHEEIKNTTTTMFLKKNITLNHVFFSYPNSQKETLKDISLTIPAFSKVGFVGTTGSGKTTLADIILGLLDVSRGTVNVDGIPITDSNKRSWQKNIGYVPQQIYLADTSVANNIAFGLETESVNQELLEKAAKTSNIHEFIINELPQGYNTIVGERGVRLSGGQRQRIGIARAIYHNPGVLILDEATSSLDNITEQAVIKTINNLEKKTTIIQIAHRLTTVMNCEKIFLLEKGVLVGQGSYRELIQNNEQFRKMNKSIG